MTHDAPSPRILDTLRRLGLTEYGARCYVALLAMTDAEASAIAEAAEVPRTKVYATLRDLVDGGWIVALGGRPVRYRAAPPEERIAAAEKRIAEDVADATRELAAKHALRTTMVPVSAYMLRGRETVLAKSLELVQRARSELFVNLGFPFEDALLAEALHKASRRGVVVRLLLAPGVPLRPYGELAEGARVAMFPFRGVIPDWRQALIVLPSTDEPVALWNPTQAFLDLLAPALQGAWEAAPRR